MLPEILYEMSYLVTFPTKSSKHSLPMQVVVENKLSFLRWSHRLMQLLSDGYQE